MSKTTIIFLSVLLALAMILPGAAIVSAESDTQPAAVARPALAVKAPNAAGIGQAVTIAVLDKFNQQPVAAVEVYALRANTVSKASDSADYAGIDDAQSIFLGVTDAGGKVVGTFKDNGRFILTAFKAGYFPGFSWLQVSMSNAGGLHLKSPGSAEVGKPATFVVTERSGDQPVAQAAIYGKRIDLVRAKAAASKPALASFFDSIMEMFNPRKSSAPIEANSTEMEETTVIEQSENATELERNGFFLGYTDENGELQYTFNEMGHFVLAAAREGYAPGFARIKVGNAAQKALRIKAPDRAEVNQPVTMAVFEKQTMQIIPGARMYALRIGDLLNGTTAENLTVEVRPQSVGVSAEETFDVETVKTRGIYLGETDDNGQLVYSFEKAGRYILAAIKDEYLPGFARVNIGIVSQKALVIRAPDRADAGKPVSIGVFVKNTAQPVSGAAVYALRLGDVIVPQAMDSTVKTAPLIVAEAENVETVKSKGLLIGYTDDKGIITYSFEKAGRYILAAIKDGYLPGFARINVVLAARNAIGIKAPDRAAAGKPVNIVTFERANYQPVPKAALYALRIGEPGSPVPSVYEAMIKSEAMSSADAEKNASDIRVKGIFLGYTNENAQLAYAFEKPGHYLLVAIKDTYSPGFARIVIISGTVVPKVTNGNVPE